ncbi:MAG: sugar phosphate isomerase/epimerase [Oscillospiraceae bacterium]|nr:sugar phosphate isomerase/epimerase [Oscillospiraceae bacterium]
MKFAVQLYSVRDHIKNGDDLLDILGKVKEIGFDGVEFAGYYGLSDEAIKARLDEVGLVAAGTHTDIKNFEEGNLNETLRFHKVLGCDRIGVGGANTATENAFAKVLATMGNANKKLEPEGIKVYFHNHQREFKRPLFAKSKATIFERLMEVCYLQVDTYWSFCAGIDNYKYLTENKDRIASIHIKDGVNEKPRALGEGECDLQAVIKGAKDIGLDWVVLENDDPSPNGLEDITRSMKYLKEHF